MPILDKTNQNEINKLIAFTRNYDDAHFYQDYRWSHVKNNLPYECVYLEENGEIVMSCSIYARPIALGRHILYAQRGPIGNVASVDLMKKLIVEMKPLIKKYKAFMVKFDPNVAAADELINEYKKAGFKIRGRGYSKLDLILSRRSMILTIEGKTIDDLMPEFKKRTRRDINKSLRSELEVIEGNTAENLSHFMELLKITAARDGIEYKDREFFENILENFTNDEVRLYLIKHDDDYLAGSFAINYGGRMTYYHSGSSNLKRNLCPNHRMQYELISWACNNGCKIYDMGGIISENEEDGLYLFKIGFCANDKMDEYIGEIDYPISLLLYGGFNFAYKLLQRIRRFYVRIKLRQANQ